MSAIESMPTSELESLEMQIVAELQSRKMEDAYHDE